MNDVGYLEMLLARLPKEALYQAHRDAEDDVLQNAVRIEELQYTVVQTAVSLERLLSDLREGPNSANYDFAVFSLTEGAEATIQGLLDVAGQTAADLYYPACEKIYDAHYTATRKQYEEGKAEEGEPE